MLFNSLQYAAFLPVVVLAYHVVPGRGRLWVLLLASYAFYASWSAAYLVLILSLTVVNYGLGVGLGCLRDRSGGSAWLLAIGVAFDLGVLAYYKYALFMLESVAAALGWIGLELRVPELSAILPIGLSFFIFEFIHYLVDVRRGQPIVRSPLDFAVFASFFPTMIAGPIKRYEDFVPQLHRPARWDWGRAAEGTRLLILGLFKKVALADNLAPLVELGFRHVGLGQAGLTAGDAWLVIIGFALQIYFDFSGYTDMGRGSALLLSYSVPENFGRPYLARNIADFWRRWHISLSTWLRDYLYIPLGGKRSWRWRNLVITMVLGGLWHGANWTFLIWGAFHGLLLVMFSRSMPGWLPPLWGQARAWRPLCAVLTWGLTMGLVAVGWVFFRAADIREALAMLGAMFGVAASEAPVLSSTQRASVLIVLVSCLTAEGIQESRQRRRPSPSPAAPRPERGLASWWPHLQPVGYVLLFVLTLLLQPSSGPRFIYFQF